MTNTTPQHLEEAELRALNNELATLIEGDKPMYATSYGELYDRNMDTKECAAEIRKTLRRLTKSKHSPLSGAKVSVRMDRFSGGSSIDVTITVDYPARVEDEEVEIDNRREGKPYPWLTDKARDAKRMAEQVRNAFNFDGSDIQTDYFNVNYYGSVDIRQARS